MNNSYKTFFISSFFIVFISFVLHGQVSITRGSEPGEIYISTPTYQGQYQFNWGILHSIDNGEHFFIQHQEVEFPPAGEMQICYVLGDATPGVLYNYGFNELWVSFDYGVTWFFKEHVACQGYLSGCIDAEIYKYYSVLEGEMSIWRSTDYGNDFYEICDYDGFRLEIGATKGVLYGIHGSLSGIQYFMHYSTNYGLDFISYSIDSSVIQYVYFGPKIYRGTEPGEVYLVSWWPDVKYRIYHSIDTGHTFIQTYESNNFNPEYWGAGFTPGRTPGSLYVMRTTFDETFTHMHLYFDYSIDYGQTFTTYFHDLDTTVGINKTSPKSYSINAFPNPFNQHIAFEFKLPEQAVNSRLQIFDLYGNRINEFEIFGNDRILWDATNHSGQRVASGLYLYQTVSTDYSSPLNKIIYISN